MAPDVSYLAAFGGGLVSFLSPCVLPIVPAYLSVITGLDVAEMREGSRRHTARIIGHSSLFIAGFSAVFIALGSSATAFGQAAFHNRALLTRVSGLVLLTMALFVLGSLFLRSPWLYQERRFHPNLSRFGPLAAPIAGVAFGFGWTPCIGPILTSVLALAATREGVARGASLLAAYSLGLGIPFLVTGLAMSRLAGALAWVKRHFVALTAASATSLAFFGVLLALDRMVWMTSELKTGLEGLGLGRLVNLG